MKAITLHQPWASLMAAGIKTIETRSSPTAYRGPLAIHAGKQMAFDDYLLELLHSDGFELPRGGVLCIVELFEVVPTETIRGLSKEEYAFGDFSDGRFAWRTRMLEVFKEPIPARGLQGLWNWERP